jgi:hypothetical protein
MAQGAPVKEDPATKQQLWTIVITGPEPFTFQAAGNPAMEHSGGTSVDHLVLTAREVGELKLLAAAAGCKVKANPMEGQNEAQIRKRQRFAGLAGKEWLWPTPGCPMCPWFDPLSAAPEDGQGIRECCGILFLPEESVQTLRATSDLHVQAEKDCERKGG